MTDPKASKYDPSPMPDTSKNDDSGNAPSSTSRALPGRNGPQGWESTHMVWKGTPDIVGTKSQSGTGQPEPPPPTVEKIDVMLRDLRRALNSVRTSLDTLSDDHRNVIHAAQASATDAGFWGQEAIDPTSSLTQFTPHTIEQNSGVGSSVYVPAPTPDAVVQTMASQFAPTIQLMQEQVSQKVANSLYLVGEWAAQVVNSGDAYASMDVQLKVTTPGPSSDHTT